ncbi:MAG: DUF2892 domain-containing protein [Anaerolineae bacterium]|nr:DUF2892 domain-containing protein [Anaerolineae bacterium]MDW8173381.1 DUF2892 domain-containing protein [Anaerolineae bacterium]
MKLKVNEGTTDRIIRGVGGAALLVGGLLVGDTAGIIMLVAGAMLLFTAATGFCGLYALLGISTCPAQKNN